MLKRSLSKQGLGLICAVLLLVPLAVQAAPTEMRVDQVEVKDCPTLKAFVSIRDAKNRPVKGLKSNKFSATVADKAAPKVKAKTFDESGEGMEVVLVLDISYSMRNKMKAKRDSARRRGRKAMEVQKDSAIEFIKGLKASDRVAVVAFGNEVLAVQDMLAPSKATQNLVKVLEHNKKPKHSKLHDGVFKGLEVARKSTGMSKRRALVVFSDGKDKDSTHTLSECITEAKKSGIAVHTVGISGLRDKAENLDHLKRLADDTRGSYSEAPDEQTLADLHKDIASQLKDIYVLRFSTPDLRGDGKERELKLSLEVSEDNTLKATRKFIIPKNQNCPYDKGTSDEPGDTDVVKYEKPIYEETWFFPAVVGAVLVIGVVVFLLVMRKKKQAEAAAQAARRCPECGQLKPEAGVPCPFCPKDEPPDTIVPEPQEPAAPPPPVIAQLLIVSGGPHGAKGHRYDLTKRSTVLGRDEDKCDILLPDEKASNVHATIFLNTEGFEIHELDSTNGTFINEHRLEEDGPDGAAMQLLNHGDEIRIGRLRMKFFDKR